MDPTSSFRHTLPLLFAPAPPLAALHASRARLLHPHIPSPACSRCGSLLVQHSSTFTNKRSARIHRRSCRICGAATNSPLPTAPFPPARRQGKIAHPSTPPSPQPPKSPPPPPPPPHPTAPPKSRHKKKPGLQHLLARNRENEEKQRQKQKQNNDSQFGGLAAFLSDLH